jgi:hypothetical protein
MTMRERTTNFPALFVVTGKIMGIGYHQASAEDARRRIVAFCKSHLN